LGKKLEFSLKRFWLAASKATTDANGVRGFGSVDRDIDHGREGSHRKFDVEASVRGKK